eukprot:scaffold5448_cov59-Phaeocystis_antarctica.AAC.3
MVVTLDVSKLSGWLNACAFCQVTPRHVEGDTGGWETRGRVGGGVAVHTACTEELTGPRHTRGGAHLKHAVHVLDTGRVEAQRLIERVRALPSHTEARGGRHGGLGCARARGGGGGARSVHGGTDRALWARHACGGAHVKHVAHARDAGRVEAQQLVERLRPLPSCTPRHVEGDTGG